MPLLFTSISFVVTVGLLCLVLNVATVWVWFSVVAGLRPASIVRTSLMYVSLYVLIAAFSFEVLKTDVEHLAQVFLWPIFLVFSVEGTFSANLYIFLAASVAISLLSLAVTRLVSQRIRVLTIVAGATFGFVVPVWLQNIQVQHQMTSKAKVSELRVIVQKSLWFSVSESAKPYFDPHGIACSTDDWPSLWSYRQREWVPLNPKTGYRGYPPEKVKEICTS